MLICDEPVSALDVSVQAQILNLLAAIRAERGIGYLFITHDLSIVRQITDYLYVMHRGRIVESGPTETGSWPILAIPYTVKLLESVPRPGPTGWPGANQARSNRRPDGPERCAWGFQGRRPFSGWHVASTRRYVD